MGLLRGAVLQTVEMRWRLRLEGRSCYAIFTLVCFEGTGL